MGMYDWHDPWAAIEQADRFEDEWIHREDEHRLQMRAVQMSCADATHHIRRQAEAMMEPMIRAKAFEQTPHFVTATEGALIQELIRK